jgi:hypothetical protein
MLRSHSLHGVPTDPRLQSAVVVWDPRVQFALVRGTRSCPALAVYDPDQLDSQLDDSTRAFCSERVTVATDADGKTLVTLPAIFEWYQEDFGNAEGDMIHWLTAYLPAPLVRRPPFSGSLNPRFGQGECEAGHWGTNETRAAVGTRELPSVGPHSTLHTPPFAMRAAVECDAGHTGEAGP